MEVPKTHLPLNAHQYAQQVTKNLQLAYELARQNLGDRSVSSDSPQSPHHSVPVPAKLSPFKTGNLVLAHHSHVPPRLTPPTSC